MEGIAMEIENEWKSHKVSLEGRLQSRKSNEKYSDFMIRYTFIE